MKRSSPVASILVTLFIATITLIILNSKFSFVRKNSINVGKVTATTDKEFYRPGESVTITINNNSTSTIIYSWHTFEHLTENGWIQLSPAGQYICGSYNVSAAIPIKPFKTFNFNWDFTTMRCAKKNSANIDPDYIKKFNRGWLQEYWYQAEEGEYRALIPYRPGSKEKAKNIYSNTFYFKAN